MALMRGMVVVVVIPVVVLLRAGQVTGRGVTHLFSVATERGPQTHTYPYRVY